MQNKFVVRTAVMCFSLAALVGLNVQAQEIGVWDFDDPSNLAKATIGEDVEIVGALSSVPGLSQTDGAALIPKGSYLLVHHGIAPNGGGGYVNNYSLVFDIKIPELGAWYSFFNTNDSNSNDGEVFVNPDGNIGVGATGYSEETISAGLWHRLAIVVDLELGEIYYYLNGKMINAATEQSLDGRFSLYSVNDSTPWILFFADDSGDDASLFVSRAAMYDYPLTDEEVQALAGPGGNEGPVEGEPITGIPPVTPSITVSPENPSGLDDITLSGSEFSSPSDSTHTQTTWQLARDVEFTNPIQTIDSATDLTTLVLLNGQLPYGVPYFARVRYSDGNAQNSEFSAPVSFQLNPPVGFTLLYDEDFENAPVNGLPDGWSEINFTDDPGSGESLDYYHPELMTWSVQPLDFLTTLTYYHDTVPVVEGNSCIASSGDFASMSFYYEAHLISPEFDLSDASEVILAFNSNYVQNQDNIAVLEYTIDGAGIDDDGRPENGAWLPIAYLLEGSEDIRTDEEGNIDAEATFDFDNIADGTNFAYVDYVFASETQPIADLAPFIFARIDDDTSDSKRFEKYALPQAPYQPSVRFHWTYMGTWSWYWGIDNVQIWGKTSTSVLEWSLY
ncbi:MAG: hypothetical protein JXR73_07710 [Candidatus Omnitrophica bacterium]|nr:hypothetical protein [Candidatus Omnitrophota bacterium]